jgi:hypothetical protein
MRNFITFTPRQLYYQMMKSRMGRACNAQRRGTNTELQWESQIERNKSEDPDVGRRIILKWGFREKGWGCIDWIHVAEDRNQ